MSVHLTDLLPPMSDAFSFQTLRRFPDLEADNLVAVDATDRLVLSEAAGALDATAPGQVVVVGDRYGAMTLGALALVHATSEYIRISSPANRHWHTTRPERGWPMDSASSP